MDTVSGIDRMERVWPDFNRVSRKEIMELFRLFSGRDPSGRQAASALLLFSDDTERLGHYPRLAAFLSRSRVSPREVPEELLLIFHELIAFAGKVPGDSDAREFFKKTLSRISPRLLRWLTGRRFPARPFLECLPPGRVFPGSSRASRDSRKRLRLLRAMLLRCDSARPQAILGTPPRDVENRTPGVNPDPALEITLADLRPLFSTPGPSGGARFSRGRPGPSAARWRRHGVHLASRGGRVSRPASPSMEKLYWGGAGNQKRAFWEKLLEIQAGELTRIRDLAHELSRGLRRVVFSWHNASLAAAGGWAFEDLSRLFPCAALWRDFLRAVSGEMEARGRGFDLAAASDLSSERARRLFASKAAHALEENRARRCVLSLPLSEEGAGIFSRDDSALAESLEKLFAHPRAGWPAETLSQGNYEWPGPLAPHQQASPEQTLTWWRRSRESWGDGLLLLFALASQGQKLLDSGKISSFVLPWIDKFFISSRRKADGAYLEMLYRFVRRNVEQPLILLWEDTAHRQAPSLGLALGDLSRRGLPFQGVGIFDSDSASHESRPGPANSGDSVVEYICSAFPGKELFALRPPGAAHCPDTYRRVFRDLDWSFFSSYDSSWKDNLVFLYTGTRVFPLLSVQTEIEAIAPWISDGHGRRPFGEWFRRSLRTRSLGAADDVSDPLLTAYASWANLL